MMLQVSQLYFGYDDQPVLSDLTFGLNAGEILYVRGANGAGKTTLLKLLAGLLVPTSGKICCEINSSYVGHKGGVHYGLTVHEFIGSDWHDEHGYSLQALMDIFELSPWQDTLCGELSMGLRKRVSLLRLLMSQAKIWFLDEPFVGLDGVATEKLNQLMLDNVAQGGAVIFTSHQSISTRLNQATELLLA